MKRFIKRFRKVTFISVFAAQGILLVLLLHEYFKTPLPYIQKITEERNEEVRNEELPIEEAEPTRKRPLRKAESSSFTFDLLEEEKDELLHNLYLETDYKELEMNPFEETLKDIFIYQLPKDNLMYLNQLFMRADLCEEAWMEEVTSFIDVLDKQSVYWKHRGDKEVQEFAKIQDNLSTSLKVLKEETTTLHIDLVKRCYKDYEAYYFAKFNWGDAV